MAAGTKDDDGCSPPSGRDAPSNAPQSAPWVDVMDADDLWIGDMIEAQTVVGPLLLVNIDGSVHAYENRCPHKGGRLSEGEFVNGVIVCPNHRWEFCAHSGRGINPAGAQLNRYAVQIVDGRILIAARTP
ncbi:Rieske 2Fe-2S domain-containing protein [Paraburkholderia sp. LEh10]|uniref:Rieske (2Fe-2S) protein n=1 Tax=Paraburkholderia sp. LEh10 TaxID=2821353 RepID=UPI001AE914B7|nr:Rieske 2Fe-2S domain-containing protein [Paraburkholderia sp. LEh10]MBP0589499.1 Rieske 2Fe-2S domain-containing protein [Paraburkholderia sp. LEh10]